MFTSTRPSQALYSILTSGFSALVQFLFIHSTVSIRLLLLAATDLSVDGETYSVGDQEFSVAPQAVANYHLNPTTADISKYSFKFVDLETTDTYKTRGHQDNLSVSPEVKKTEVNNGILSVYFDFDATNVNDATIDKSTGKAWVSTLALQATQKNLEDEDATVTSDYAVLSPTFANDLDLGNNEYKDRSDH
jgi:hypothetical protein